MSENVGNVSLGVNLDESSINGQISRIGNSSGGIIKNILSSAFSFTLGQGLFDTIKTGFRAGINASIGFDNQMQQNQISFETMLGSADKAKAFMDWAQKFAASTPFELNDLVTGSKRLLAFGFDAQQIPEMMTAIGDAASGLGLSGAEGINRIGTALGQMGAKGKVSAEEMMQLTEAGIPAWDLLAQGMNKSTAEVMDLSSKGLLPAKQSIDILIDGMEQRFPSMMDKQSKSFSGLMSTLKDNVQSTLGNIVKPKFEELTNAVLPKLIDITGSVSTTYKDTGSVIDAVSAGISTALGDKAGGAFKTVATGAKDVFGWIADHQTLVVTAIGAIAGAMTAYKAVQLAANIAAEVHNGLLVLSAIQSGGAVAGQAALTAATGGTTIAQWLLNSAFLACPITWIVLGIGAVIAIIVVLWNKSETFRNVLLAIFDGIKGYFEIWWAAVSGLFKATIGAIGGYFQGLWSGVQNVFGNIKAIFLNIIDFVMNAFTGNWSGAWQNIVNIFGNIFGGIGNIAKLPINAIIEGLNGFISGANKIKVPDWVPGIGGKSLNWSYIPKLATGGIVKKQMTAVIGEAGPEAVVPLSRNAEWVKVLMTNIASLIRPILSPASINTTSVSLQSPIHTETYTAIISAIHELRDAFLNSGGRTIAVNFSNKTVFEFVIDMIHAEEGRTGKKYLLN